MREQALAELLKFPDLTPENKEMIGHHLDTALKSSTTEYPLSPTWIEFALALCEKVGSPIPAESLKKFLSDLTQPPTARIVALDALIEDNSGIDKILMTSQSNGLRPLILKRWFQHHPESALAFCRYALGLEMAVDDYWDQRLYTRDQKIIQFLSSLASPDADAILGESISGLILKDRLDQAVWLEVQEALTARGDAIKTETHQLFKKLVADSSLGPLPDDRYPALLEGGDRARGEKVALSKKARCIECHELNKGGTFSFFSSESLKASRQENLRSLIAPEHDVIPGTGFIVMKLNDGTIISGPEFHPPGNLHYFYRLENGESEIVEKKDVVSLIRSSPMPSALDSLSHREIRDLVAYLTQGLVTSN